ncbi:hypothetical protein [Ochrobactrum sp. A-1]|uniref:hypothetical protein n=1 Tax=Ochrobactrum sp. A-1 TaxID=2920940 RepID=UPI001F0A1E4A|nr:hypothetical protein [Ochrobactrum sp. A-1]
MPQYVGKSADKRIVFLVDSEVLDQIDGWGVPAGMPSRSHAIRALLIRGLEAVKSNEMTHEKAAYAYRVCAKKGVLLP